MVVGVHYHKWNQPPFQRKGLPPLPAHEPGLGVALSACSPRPPCCGLWATGLKCRPAMIAHHAFGRQVRNAAMHHDHGRHVGIWPHRANHSVPIIALPFGYAARHQTVQYRAAILPRSPGSSSIVPPEAAHDPRRCDEWSHHQVCRDRGRSCGATLGSCTAPLRDCGP